MVDWNLSFGDRLPTNRHAYPKAPFASLRTIEPEDADRAYALYHEAAVAGRELLADELLTAFAGRPFRALAVEATHQYRSRWTSPPQPITDEWIRARQLWVCEYLVHNQYAYETTAAHLEGLRESSMVSAIEVISDAGACPACAAVAGRHPVENAIEIPVPGCTHDEGCRCVIAPVLTRPLGEVELAVVEPAAPRNPADLITFNEDLTVEVRFSSPAEAKLVIKQLKLDKEGTEFGQAPVGG